MPAILRIFLPKRIASLVDIGPYAQNEANAGSGGHGLRVVYPGGSPSLRTFEDVGRCVYGSALRAS